MNRLFEIPVTINDMDRLTAARFYSLELGWAIHPLCPPDRGDEMSRGKKPIAKGWRQHTAAKILPGHLERYFANGGGYNLGCVVRAPFVHVDLDSKSDQGESVMKWLKEQLQLQAVPCEETSGGAHLVFICRDLPDSICARKKALSAEISDAVTAELYHDGLNIVLSPSVHKSGQQYRWMRTGTIPEISWDQLSQWFGFDEPETKKRGRPCKSPPWWGRYRGNLSTLDLVGTMRELEMLGEEISSEEGKWSVRCPWQSVHSDGGNREGARPGSDTVIFVGDGKEWPAFSCLHSHCENQRLEQVCEWAEERQPGVVDRHCSRLRVWESGQKPESDRPEVLLASLGRSISEFADELGTNLGPKHQILLHSGMPVRVACPEANGDDAQTLARGLQLKPISAAALVTVAECYVETGILSMDSAGDWVFRTKSMSEQMAKVTLVSQQLQGHLAVVRRILDVPIPCLLNGEVVMPRHGYDSRLLTYLDPNAPTVSKMPLDEALSWLLGEVLAKGEDGGFCFEDDQSRAHALARLITPFCRGLMNWKRSPLWIYLGNREGCGKDTLAQTAFVLYTGQPVVGAPLSKDSDAEMRKRITSALLAGARFVHFANMKGHVKFAALEAATDNTGIWDDRILGLSQSVELPNEIEFSLSANAATWEPDLERRCRRISLHFSPEEINARTFRHPDITAFIRKHRREILSAVASMVRHWLKQGRPPGPTPFSSFPEWAEVVGGIMHTCGLPNPCQPHQSKDSVSGDQNTENMRSFYQQASEQFDNDYVSKKEVVSLIEDSDGELFPWINLSDRSGQTLLGKLLSRFNQRELSGITLEVNRLSKNNVQFRFHRNDSSESVAPGTSGTSGTSSSIAPIEFQKIAPIFSHQREHGEHREPVIPPRDGDLIKEAESKRINISRNGIKEPAEVPNVPNVPSSIIHSDALGAIADKIFSAKRVALDIETFGEARGDGLNPWRGDIRLLSLSIPGEKPWLIDLQAVGYELGDLGLALSEAEVIGHNLKFDALWLRKKCGLRLRQLFCTMTAERLITAGLRKPCSLADVLRRHLRLELPKEQQTSDWGGMLLTEDQLTYAANDVIHLHGLRERQIAKINQLELAKVFDLEMRLLPAIVEMEYNGFLVDSARLEQIRQRALAEAKQFQEALRDRTGNGELNLASPKQLLAALEMAGIDVTATSEEALKATKDQNIVPLILGFRGAEKTAQQAASLMASVADDGRIHSQFEPTGTDTGRFSSKRPNLQNVARGELRQCFIAPSGRSLVVADYSQAELRAAAQLAGETRMLEAYQKGEDLHAQTAAIVKRKKLSEVTSDDRQLAKAVNFGLLYGQSAGGLVRYAASAYGIALSESEAQDIRNRFFSAYPSLKKWHESAHKAARSGASEIRTPLGRLRRFPNNDDAWRRFTGLVNTPVQGGCADVMKLALQLVAGDLNDDQKLISTVHDEMVLEVPKTEAASVAQLVEQHMINAMNSIFPGVATEVEVKISDCWEKGKL